MKVYSITDLLTGQTLPATDFSVEVLTYMLSGEVTKVGPGLSAEDLHEQLRIILSLKHQGASFDRDRV